MIIVITIFIHFQEDKISELASPKNMQMSCLQLGFYLARWGMMRNSFLLEKSVKNYEKLINSISNMNPKLWEYMWIYKAKLLDMYGFINGQK